ncbi:MAG: twin-arginine translocation signal domain-containing protein [Gemmatimonadales bacterium]|nr:MAG: twin-arginine translocation signal domain-containing protein [Gemmatimonadales bacterium]
MLSPSPIPWTKDQTLGEHLEERGVSRRDFLAFCGQIAVVLGLGEAAAPQVAHALQAVKRPSVIWLQLQECTGCVESVIRTSEPTIGDLVLDLVSLDYQHTLMAGAGHAVESALQDAMKANYGQYVLIVTGSVPTKEGGIYCTIGGRTAQDILEEAAKGAAAILAVGACAHFGSVQAARPNPTGAVGVGEIIKDRPVVNIAGCPPIGDVVTATVVHFLTFNRLPDLDPLGRPMFAYGARIHDQCPRRANFDAGQYVEKFDDEAARKGWCLYHVGCKGPATFSPCPIFQWNTRTNWPIGAGHPCIGCTEPHFWDTMSPFYDRLPDVGGFGIEQRVDLLGAALALGATAGVVAHAAATGVHQMRERKRQLPVAGTQGPGSGPDVPPQSRGRE